MLIKSISLLRTILKQHKDVHMFDEDPVIGNQPSKQSGLSASIFSHSSEESVLDEVDKYFSIRCEGHDVEPLDYWMASKVFGSQCCCKRYPFNCGLLGSY